MAFPSGHLKIYGINFLLNKSGEYGVNFKQAKAGHNKINKFWLSLVGIIISSLLSIIPVISAKLLGALIVAIAAKNDFSLFFVIISVTLGYAANIILPIFQGIQIEQWLLFMGLLTIGSGLTTIPFGSQLNLLAVVLYFSLSIGLAWLGIILAALAATFNFICCGLIGESLGLLGSALIATLTTILSQINENSVQESEVIITLMAALLVLIVGSIIAQKALKGDSKFAGIRDQAVFWAATGGTSFYGCDLTDACFDGADLPHTDFRQSKLTRASFEGATRLDLSRLQ
ncbi:MAG: pentapeptide repeat-containing protein, partial [Planktothrix sp.]